MSKNKFKYLKLVTLAVALPFIYGCGGAGVGSLVGFLFGSGLGSVGEIALLGASGGGAIAGASSVASLTQPEPASMLLVGSGIMAMSYFKSKTNHRNK